VLLVSKSDLASPAEVESSLEFARKIQPGLKALGFSNLQPGSLQRVREIMEPGRTYCLLGSSGVGKTTLLNNLLGGGDLSTREVRQKDGKGRHATTSRELIILDNGAMIIDTPGMRELGNLETQQGLVETLAPKLRRSPNLKNRVSDEVEEAVLKLSHENPTFGKKKISRILKEQAFPFHRTRSGLFGIEMKWLRWKMVDNFTFGRYDFFQLDAIKHFIWTISELSNGRDGRTYSVSSIFAQPTGRGAGRYPGGVDSRAAPVRQNHLGPDGRRCGRV